MNESRRRHGLQDRIESGGSVGQLAKGAREQLLGKREGEKAAGQAAPQSEDKLRAALRKRRDED